MALAQQYVEKTHYTEAEYFEFERTAFGRWEHVNGEVRQLSSGTDDHGMIITNLICALGNVLVPQGNRVYMSNMKVHTGNSVNTFPDVMAVIGPRHYHTGRTDIITNPALVVEVLSSVSRDYDRCEKFDCYRTIETLTDYLLVEQDKPSIIFYTRQDDHWEMREVKGLDGAVHLPSVNVTLALRDVYRLIEFGAE